MLCIFRWFNFKKGGQNPLEAARFGAKILHGPNVDNFKDVYKLLKLLKISKKINTPIGLASEIVFTKNKNMGQKIKNIGEKILKKIIKELDKLINNEFKKPKFWNYNKPNIFAYLLFPFSILITLVNFLKK